MEGDKPHSVLGSAEQARVLFAELAREFPEHALPHARRLESYCEARRQADRQKRLQFWLDSWRWVHFPLSVALLVVLLWQVVASLKWW